MSEHARQGFHVSVVKASGVAGDDAHCDAGRYHDDRPSSAGDAHLGDDCDGDHDALRET